MSFTYQQYQSIYGDAVRGSGAQDKVEVSSHDLMYGFRQGTAKHFRTIGQYPFEVGSGYELSSFLDDSFGKRWLRTDVSSSVAASADNIGYKTTEKYEISIRIRGVYSFTPWEVVRSRLTIFGGSDIFDTRESEQSKLPIAYEVPADTVDRTSSTGVYYNGYVYTLRNKYITNGIGNERSPAIFLVLPQIFVGAFKHQSPWVTNKNYIPINYGNESLKAVDMVLRIQVSVNPIAAGSALTPGAFGSFHDFSIASYFDSPFVGSVTYKDDKGLSRLLRGGFQSPLSGAYPSKKASLVNDGTHKVLSLPAHNPADEWIYAEILSVSPLRDPIPDGIEVTHLQPMQ